MTSDFVPFALPDIGNAEIEAVVAAMRTGWLSSGPSVRAFEEEFADFLGGGVEAVAVNSATAGLHLALEALGVAPGDEVLVPTWTFTATAEVVRYLGADPVFVDSLPSCLNIDLSSAAGAVSAKTKAVLPVHFAGLPCSETHLQTFAREHSLPVVEDAAHAFPAKSGNKLIGAGHSLATIFSFYATKTMTTGEGGMLVTRDPAIAQRARIMRLHGISRDAFDRYRSTAPSWRYDVVAPGFKYNMPDPAAAMGRVQLGRAQAMRLRRQSLAEFYTAELGTLPIDLPAPTPSDRLHAWHLFVIRLRDSASIDRDSFVESMSRLGVGCSVHFIPLHMQPYWRSRYNLQDSHFPVASAEFRRVVSLPIFSSMTDEQAHKVVAAVRKALDA